MKQIFWSNLCTTLCTYYCCIRLQPLGERDPTQAEQISGFADKPLGFYDTSHVVRSATLQLYLYQDVPPATDN